MAVALWVLGDSEAEVTAELARLRLRPAGRLLPCTGRARWMQRAAPAADTGPDVTEAATHDG
jgi:hypothetical protein